MTQKDIVWIFNHYAFPEGYGFHTRQHVIAKKLVVLGYDVVVFASSFNHLKTKKIDMNGQKSLIEEIDGIKYIWIATREYIGNGLKRVLNSIDYSINLNKVFDKIEKKPDFLWASSPHPFVIYNSIKIKKEFKCKLIFEERDIWPLTLIQINKINKYNPLILFFRYLQLKAYANSDLIVSPLSNLKEFISLSGFPKKKVEILIQPFSSVVPEPYSLKLPEDKFIVGYVGSIGESNSVFNLIKSANLLKKNVDIFFLVVGDGPQLEDIKKYTKENNINNIVFTGKLKKAFALYLMDKCNILYSGNPNIELYKYGTASVKLLDYMWVNKPIINATNTIDDVVELSNSGIIIESNNEKILAITILKLKENNFLYNSFLNNGRMYINNNCSKIVILERISNIMKNF